jgi:hypothetical protein
MQRAGYSEFTDPRTGEISYTRRLRTHFYPRWHVYLEQHGQELQISLHLDQKQPSYPGFTKHSGEYDGEIVEAEADRIAQYFG